MLKQFYAEARKMDKTVEYGKSSLLPNTFEIVQQLLL